MVSYITASIRFAYVFALYQVEFHTIRVKCLLFLNSLCWSPSLLFSAILLVSAFCISWGKGLGVVWEKPLSREYSCPWTTWNLVFEFEMKSIWYILGVKRPWAFETVLGKYEREAGRRSQFKVAGYSNIHLLSVLVIPHTRLLIFSKDYLRIRISSPVGWNVDYFLTCTPHFNVFLCFLINPTLLQLRDIIEMKRHSVRSRMSSDM
jgi:hypothetical protein